jgi:hypothetical protein
MALPVVFATQPTGNVLASGLDSNFNAVGALGTIPCTTSGTNAITLSPSGSVPTVSSYVTFQLFSFIAAATTTGSVTIQVNALTFLPLFLSDGVTQAGSGTLLSGSFYVIAFNQALNTGVGGFQIITPTATPTIFRGYLAGLTLSNDGTTPNTVIDVSAGVATDSTNTLVMNAPTAQTINCATTGAGGLDTGSLAASTWYHAFLIGKTNGVVSTLASTSVSSPTMPTGYTLLRRLGSFKTNSSSQIIAFIQDGDYFWWKTPNTDDVSTTSSTTPANITVNSPLGVNVVANWQANAAETASNGSGFVRVYDPDVSDFTVNSSNSSASFGIVANFGTAIVRSTGNGWTRTNTSSQLRVQSDISTSFTLRVVAWIDARGRFS